MTQRVSIAAIVRGDDIVFATKPDPVNLLVTDDRLTMFGREVHHSEQNGFHLDGASGKMVLGY